MKVFSPERLQEVLKDPRLKLIGVAKVAGVAVHSIYAARDGRRVPSADTVAKIASALNKPIDYFFEEESVVRARQQQLSLGREVANG